MRPIYVAPTITWTPSTAPKNTDSPMLFKGCSIELAVNILQRLSFSDLIAISSINKGTKKCIFQAIAQKIVNKDVFKILYPTFSIRALQAMIADGTWESLPLQKTSEYIFAELRKGNDSPFRTANALLIKTEEETNLLVTRDCSHIRHLTLDEIPGLSAGLSLGEMLAQSFAIGHAMQLQGLIDIPIGTPEEMAQAQSALNSCKDIVKMAEMLTRHPQQGEPAQHAQLQSIISAGNTVKNMRALTSAEKTPNLLSFTFINLSPEQAPFILANKLGLSRVFDLLLTSNKDINKPFREWRGDGAPDTISTLHWFIERMIDETPADLALIEKLIKGGANVNEPLRRSSSAFTSDMPLHMAAKKGFIGLTRLLLDNRADINGQGSYSYTAIAYAAESGQTEVVRLLIERGADLTLTSGDRTLPGGSMHRLTPLEHASWHGHIDIIRLLIDNGAKPSGLAVSMAILGRKTEIVDPLLAYGAPVDGRDKDLMTPLHYAAEYGNAEAVSSLVAKGADINALDRPVYSNKKGTYSIGNTPLDLAEEIATYSRNKSLTVEEFNSNKGEAARVLRDLGAKRGSELANA